MPVEDFTTYTEIEEITDIFSVAANKIDFIDAPLNESSYVYKDFGVGHFGDFEYLITFYASSNNLGSSASFCGCAQQNEITDFKSVTGDGLYIHLSLAIGWSSIQIVEKDGGVIGSGDYDNISFDTPYYLTVSRNGDTYQALIYDDEGRTNLVNTISITCITTAFRYNLAVSTYNLYANTNRHITGYIRNLDLQIVANPVFDPVEYEYIESVDVTITCATDGATIKYTTDGSEPASDHGTEYTVPVTIGVGIITLKAIAYKAGMTDSDVVSGIYTVVKAWREVIKFDSPITKRIEFDSPITLEIEFDSEVNNG